MKGNIPYFDCYHVTREGNVYSKYRDRVTWRKMAKRKKNNGYLIVSLRNNKGIKYTFNIHRLVALIYIPNPDNKPCVGHKDNNRENNKVENLYWCTNQENTQQCIRDGRGYIGDKNPRAKVKNLDREIIRRKFTLGSTINGLTKEYNLSRSAIRKILYLSI